MAKIGSRILALRKQAGITQQELANKVGYKSKSAINKIELGTRDISQSKIILFANALNVSPACLMGIEESQNTLISESEQQIIDLIKDLNIDEIKELSNYIDYIISKRK